MKKTITALSVVILVITAIFVYTFCDTFDREQRAIECAAILTPEEYEIVKKYEELPFTYEVARNKYEQQSAEYDELLEYSELCNKINKQ